MKQHRTPAVFKLYGHVHNVEYTQLYIEAKVMPDTLLSLSFYEAEGNTASEVFVSSWATVEGMGRLFTDLQTALLDQNNTEARFDLTGYDLVNQNSIRMTAVMTKEHLSSLLDLIHKSIVIIERSRLTRAVQEI